MGSALAQALAARGCRLALADIDTQSLRRLAGTLPAVPLTATVDVADRAAVFAFAEQVGQHFGGADILINNAGVNVTAAIEQLSPEDLSWLMDINFYGAVHGTQAFLPMFRARRRGSIVNISSLFGMLGWPMQSAYCASKFALRGFTEALQGELRGSGVQAVLVMPGGIRTDIVGRGRFHPAAGQAAADQAFKRLARTLPEQAAQQILLGLEQGRERILIGRDVQLVDGLQRLLPRHGQAILARLLERFG